MILRPWGSRARARASTTKALSVPRRRMESASAKVFACIKSAPRRCEHACSVWLDNYPAATLSIANAIAVRSGALDMKIRLNDGLRNRRGVDGTEPTALVHKHDDRDFRMIVGRKTHKPCVIAARGIISGWHILRCTGFAGIMESWDVHVMRRAIVALDRAEHSLANDRQLRLGDRYLTLA